MTEKRKRGRPPKIKKVDSKIPRKKRKLQVLSKKADFDRHLERATQMSSHIPSKYSLTPDERSLAFMAALALPEKSTIVELGVGNGKTAALLIYASKVTNSHYHGVDHFGMSGMSYQQTKNNLDKLQVDYTLHNSYTSDLDWPEKNIDYLLFDAGHDHLNMSLDTTQWLPRLKQGGFALFHAYNPKADMYDAHFPVKRFADQYTKEWLEIEYIPSLLIKQKLF